MCIRDRLKADEADSGAVTLIQRFGSAANLNVHVYCLVLDGVYRRATDAAPAFVKVSEPTDEALQAVLHKVITRMSKLLTRRGRWSKNGWFAAARSTGSRSAEGRFEPAGPRRTGRSRSAAVRWQHGGQLSNALLTLLSLIHI